MKNLHWTHVSICRQSTHYALCCALLFLVVTSASAQGDRNLTRNNVYPSAAFTQNGGNVIDITRSPYNAVPNDGIDDTAAFIRAYDFLTSEIDRIGWTGQSGVNVGGEFSYIIYIPNGTYNVSDTIIYSGPMRQHPNSSQCPNCEALQRVRFIGQSRQNTIIRLLNNVPGFSDPANPKAVVSFTKRSYNNVPGDNYLRNLTIDTGSGNPGAVGVKYVSANSAGINNITIRSGDGQGVVGLDFPIGDVHGYHHDITVDGFSYGISMNVQNSVCPALEYITVKNQTTAGIRIVNSSPTIRSLRSENSAPAVIVTDDAAHVVISDAALVNGASGNTAVDLQSGHLFLRNATVSGYGSSVKKGGTVVRTGDIGHSGSNPEYVSDPIFKFSSSSPNVSMNLPVEDAPEAVWGDIATDWAAPNGTDSAAVQAAMNSGESVIYLPRKQYTLNTTVTIPASVKTVNLMFSQMQGSASPKFRMAAGSSDPLVVMDGGTTGGPTLFEHNHQRTLVLDHASAANSPYTNTFTSRTNVKVFFNAVHGVQTIKNVDAWARFINNEALSEAQRPAADNSTVWVMNTKTESPYINFTARNGAKLEALGFQIGRWGGGWPAVKKLGIVNDNSEISIIASTNGPSLSSRPNSYFDPLVRDIQGGTTTNTAWSDFPARDSSSDRVIPLYVNYTPAAEPPAPPATLTATPGNAQVSLSWSASADATSYEVVRDGTVIATGVTSTSYTDTGLTNGVNYCYTVRAVNSAGASGDSTQACATPVAPGQPDLVVTDVSWSPASPVVGNAVTFSATIKNQGAAATPDGVIHGVRFRVDGTTVSCSDNSTATLAAGSSRVVTANNCGVTWTATAGTHTVEAYVDDINRIPNESDETNNTLTESLTPGSGAVTIVYEAVNPPAAKSSDTHTSNSDAGASGGTFTKLASNAVNDYVTYAIPNVEARAYTVTVRIKRRLSRGICRMAIANTLGGTYTNIGNPFDQYGASEVFADVTVGTINPTSSGTKYLRFTVTGRNGSSTGYELTFDKITLTPQ